MRIKNKKTKANYINYKSSGMSKKVEIKAGKTKDIKGIVSVSQIINLGDFQRGFFEIIEDNIVEVEKKEIKIKKTEDSFLKIKKEVKDYTNNQKK